MSRTVVSECAGHDRGDPAGPAEALPDTKPTPSNVVTLMVTPEDAERIALAQSEGQIMLILRNPLDGRSGQHRRRQNRSPARPTGAGDAGTGQARRDEKGLPLPPPPSDSRAPRLSERSRRFAPPKRTEEVIR